MSAYLVPPAYAAIGCIVDPDAGWGGVSSLALDLGHDLTAYVQEAPGGEGLPQSDDEEAYAMVVHPSADPALIEVEGSGVEVRRYLQQWLENPGSLLQLMHKRCPHVIMPRPRQDVSLADVAVSVDFALAQANVPKHLREQWCREIMKCDPCDVIDIVRRWVTLV